MKKTLLMLLMVAVPLLLGAQTLLSESFNVTSTTSSLPTGWTVTGSGTNVGCHTIYWEQVVSGGFACSFTGPAPNPAPHSGTGMAGYNSWDISYGGSSELISPVLDFSAAGTNTLSFWVYNYAGFYLHDSIRVYVNTSPTSAGGTMLFALDPVYNPSPTGWTQYTTTIPTTYITSTNYIIFRGHSDYGYDVFFDDVDVTHNAPTPCSGTPLIPSITTAALSPATSPKCSGSTHTMNAFDPNFPTTGGITYQWQSSTTSAGPWTNVTGGSGATTRTYTTASLTTSTYYRIGATCSNSSITSYSAAYYVPVGAPQPGSITGSSTFCPGDQSTYTVPNVSGTVYTWTIPGGWSGGSTTNSIAVTAGNAPGNISVVATTGCGTSIPQTLTLVAGSAPGQPSTMSGNASICPNTSQTYSVGTVAGATSYLWSLPAGWTGSSSTNSITVFTGSGSGNVSVQAVNGCGQSIPTVLPVTVTTTLSSPGVITGPDTPCSGGLYTYSISAVPGATSYFWTFPSGWSGTNTGTSVQVFPGTSGGLVTVTAFMSCATSPSANLPVVVRPTLPASVLVTSSTTGAMCQNVPITFTATPVNGGTTPQYQWKINGINQAGSGNTFITNTLSTGDVVSVAMTTSYACPVSPTVNSNNLNMTITPAVTPGVSINTTPSYNICAGTPLTFSTVVNGGGTAPGYQWYKNGNAVAAATGSSYTDAGLIDQDTITVRLTSNAVCATTPSAASNKVVVSVTNVVVPSIAVSASSTVLNGAPITFTATYSGGGATPQFQWMKNNVDIPLATSSAYTATGLRNGDRIAVRMLSYAPCATPEIVASNEIEVNSPLSIAGVGGWDGHLSLYPNPTGGKFTIGASWAATHIGKRVSIDVVSVIGQGVYHSEVAPDRTDWHYDVTLPEGLANGSYMLRLSSDGMKATVPFVLNR